MHLSVDWTSWLNSQGPPPSLIYHALWPVQISMKHRNSMWINGISTPKEDSCDLQYIRTAITFQEPRQLRLDQGRSRSLVPQSGMICLPVWRILLWAKTLSENCLKHFYLIDDRYFCAFAVFINLRGEMFIINIYNSVKT